MVCAVHRMPVRGPQRGHHAQERRRRTRGDVHVQYVRTALRRLSLSHGAALPPVLLRDVPVAARLARPVT